MFSNVRLKRDDLGGVFLAAPSALCGFPVLTQGSSGLPVLPCIRAHAILLSSALTSASTIAVSALLADISSKVCQGVRFP